MHPFFTYSNFFDEYLETRKHLFSVVKQFDPEGNIGNQSNFRICQYLNENFKQIQSFVLNLLNSFVHDDLFDSQNLFALLNNLKNEINFTKSELKKVLLSSFVQSNSVHSLVNSELIHSLVMVTHQVVDTIIKDTTNLSHLITNFNAQE